MKILDLFCGAGGFSTGFQQAGHQIIYGIDNDVRVKKTYQQNHPTTKFILNDVRRLNPEAFYDMDIVIGSPPCPNFSIANSHRDIEKGMELVNIFMNWVEKICPRYWILENVPPIKSHLDGRYPMKVILDAVNYGVPQFRKRCFAGKFRVPVPTHAKVPVYTLDGGKLEKWRTVKDVIGDLILVSPQLILTDQRGNIENCKSHTPIYDASNRPSRTITNIAPRQIMNHCCMDNVIESKFDQSNREVKSNRPAPTINTHFRSERKIKTQIMQRRLSVRECARLQSFPDEFIFYRSVTAQYMMVGNAVPPKMSFALGKILLE